MDLYIYYHAAAGDAASVQAAVCSLQQHLRARAASAPSAAGQALRCGLKRRPPARDAEQDLQREQRDERDTWMEIYLAVPDTFPALLDAAVAESELPRLIDGNRHVEIFVEALPCA